MKSYTLVEIARKINGETRGDHDVVITGTAEIDKAAQGELTFLANPKYLPHLKNSIAAAVVIDKRVSEPPSIPHIVVDDAYYGFLQAFLMFHEPVELLPPGIHPAAVIDPTATLDEDVRIGANVYIGPGVTVGARTRIAPNCVILNGSCIGVDCLLYPLVSIREDCIIGNRIIMHSGVVIGSDGFGFAPREGRFHKIPQVGKVIIEDDVELGANVAIDRATMGETRICQGVKLDNLVHVAHNVVIGKHSVIAGQSGISGSTRVGENVMMGGQVGLVGHIQIGDRARIAGQSGVTKSLDEGEVVLGSPSRPIRKMKRIEATLDSLPEMRGRLRVLEKRLDELEASRGKD